VTDYPGGYSEYLARTTQGTLLTRRPAPEPAPKAKRR